MWEKVTIQKWSCFVVFYRDEKCRVLEDDKIDTIKTQDQLWVSISIDKIDNV